jgi:ribosome biogenesis GTPase
MADTVTGQVLYGINTIYAVLVDGVERQCRIKGKVLKGPDRSYNPIAAGDFAEIWFDPLSPSKALISTIRERRSVLARWNRKGRARQVLAANADLAVCVTSPGSPPFRPRFIDRVIAAAEAGGMEAAIVMNKSDLGADAEIRDRLEDFKRMGYPVRYCSALTGEGIRELADLLQGKTSAFVGQSGVGKSSLLNSLRPGLGLKVGEISRKYDRGVHTTNFSVLLRLDDELRVIDTPGIRELELADILPEELAYSFREFGPFAASCEVPVCPHDGEPGCAVRAAVERGEIHPDRYESYLRILGELRESRRSFHG